MKGAKVGYLLLTLLVGSLAVPLQNSDGPSQEFFFHTDPSARIVGGSPAPIGSTPYMAALTQGALLRSLLCGASILTPRTALTAAHCIAAVFSFGSLNASLRVTVGTNQFSSGGQMLTVARNVTHPHYVSSTIKNDIGLLITSTNIGFNALVGPIAMDNQFIGGGVQSRVTGWGRIVAGGALSANLLEIFINTITGEQCVRDVPIAAAAANLIAPAVEPHIELCTFHSVGRGTCNGDSGSPLVRVSNGLQIGVVSWGIPCARGGPDMFVRVSAFTAWVRANTV